MSIPRISLFHETNLAEYRIALHATYAAEAKCYRDNKEFASARHCAKEARYYWEKFLEAKNT